MTGETADIKVRITNDECYTNPTNLSVPMRRDIWGLQRAYQKHGNKIGTRHTVAWG